VVGAGPAGMFAARKIAMTGNQVMIFNRALKLWIDQILSTIVASRAKVRQTRSSQLAIARPISSGVSSCTKWRPLTTTRC
jgi:ribulose 1,5-bisphosphate synthetase/thiazole synthase